MAYAKCDEIIMPIFDGSDYNNWKIRIIKFLQFKKCRLAIEREMLPSDNREIWEEMDVKATNYIYSAISNKQLEYVSNLDSAYKVIKKFDEMYLEKSTALQIVCRNSLESIKLKNYPEVTNFFDDFEKSVNDLKAAGASITEQEKLNYMLRSLPRNYSHIGDLIDVLPEKDRTIDYLKSKIKLKAIEEKTKVEKDEEIGGKTNVFTAVDQNKTGNKSQGTCYNCGKQGHFRKDCRQGNMYNNRGNHGYRGRGQQPRGRGKNQSYRGFQQPNKINYNGGREGNCFMVKTAESMDIIGPEKEGINWILDSGCTNHIVNQDKYFNRCVILKEPIKVRVGDGRMLEATKIGNIETYFTVNSRDIQVTLKNVFYVKQMKENLISYSSIMKKNKVVSTGNVTKIYNRYNECIAVAVKNKNLLTMKSYINKQDDNVCVNLTTKHKGFTQKEKWHRILGHTNFNCLNKMCKNNLLDGIPEDLGTEYLKCAICIQNKMHNMPFENKRTKATDILEIIHTDVNGPHMTTGYKGEKYFVSFIDDYSKLCKVYCISSKNQVYDCLVQYINEIENLTGKRIKKVRCDNGREYLNSKFYQFAREKGIQINTCPPYVHELNGTAERFNRSIMDMARCLMAEAKVKRIFWPECVIAAAYLKNRILANTEEKKTPYEIFFKKKPNVRNLRLYGSKVFVRIPEQKRQSKWDKKAELGVLLGYTDVGYRVLVDDKVMVTRHVDIIEEDTRCIGFEDTEDKESKIENRNEQKGENDTVKEEEVEETDETEDEEGVQMPRRSSRVSRPPTRYHDEYIYANYCSINVPTTYQEAVSCNEAEQWQAAMDREIKSINENNTWELVNKPEKEILDVKWVYSKKNGNIYKARLVVRGFQQREEVENIYSPVFKMQTLKVLLAYCCQENLEIEQMDVETAFLNGKITSEIYVNQPKGFYKNNDKVYKLRKALYGLKGSPRIWYDCFNEYVKCLGFERCNYDYCLYSKVDNEGLIFILLFVDDLLICSKSTEKIAKVKAKLKKRFKMKDMGKVKSYIGIEIKVKRLDKTVLTLTQEEYITSLANRYKIIKSKLYDTPMETKLKLEPAKEINPDIMYRNLIGALLYIALGTRPDVAFSVNYLSRYQNCYDETHFKYALRVLKYLYLTRSFKLTYYKNDTAEILDSFVDADWAGDAVDRKSTSGYVIRLFGNVVFWKSKKQSSITKSSTSAEYVALSEVVTEINAIREMIKSFNLECKKPTKVYEDNKGAVIIARNGNFTKNSKHIEVQYHYVHENYLNRTIDVVKIKTDDNMADIFTKALDKRTFEKFRDMLKLRI